MFSRGASCALLLCAFIALAGCEPNEAVWFCEAGRCDANCVNLLTNPSHCGACGRACSARLNQVASCDAGTCSVACAARYASCTTDGGCETNTMTDERNCGRCGMVCRDPGGVTANTVFGCHDGQCTRACVGGFGNCDSNPDNGCETNIRTHAAHCGRCGAACSLANATPVCRDGVCAIGTCNPGFDHCDTNVANGCETDIRTNLMNCGSCGRSCMLANATARCVGGMCTVGTCSAGFGNCDTNDTNGCETNTLTNPMHCGMCGRACMLANATAGCAAGMCTIASCNPGFVDCNRSPMDGCEVNVNTSLAHCGGCDRACAFANAVASCNAGVCTMGACNVGWGNCDDMSSNGCEADLRSDLMRCGRCDRACAALPGVDPTPMGTTCANQQCGIALCRVNLEDCDRNSENGCETNLTSDPNNCNMCGNRCPTTASRCVGRRCVP